MTSTRLPSNHRTSNLAAQNHALPTGEFSQHRQSAWNLLSVFCGWSAVLAAVVWSYAEPLTMLSKRWAIEPDYSHGFLIPVFSAYLLWYRRSMFRPESMIGNWWGLVLLLGAGFMRWYANYYFYPLIDVPSLLPCLAGLTLLVGGWSALRWAWPSICFLIFMVPLPGFLSTWLSHPLQRMATISSTWLLQLLGLPAVAQGNVIWLTTARIGVIEACSGLRMLMLFLAITVGASFLIRRPLWEKVFVGLSALVIGVTTNIVRITVTGFLYEYADAELAEMVFHDLAGWLMMPVATLLLCLELFLLSKLLMAPDKFGPVHLKR